MTYELQGAETIQPITAFLQGVPGRMPFRQRYENGEQEFDFVPDLERGTRLLLLGSSF
jgi:hypothetical protein